MAKAPKTSYELAMERLRAADPPASKKEKPLTPAQKEEIAEARRVAAARLAECEILFNDPLKQFRDPVEREKAEGEYQIDRQRINADLERRSTRSANAGCAKRTAQSLAATFRRRLIFGGVSRGRTG
jgi:hypothetical protein